MGVNEAEDGDRVRVPRPRVEREQVVRQRLAGRCDPLFPLVGVLRLLVGVQQQVPAERASPVLALQQPQPGPVQQGFPASSPGHPVVGQGGVVGGRPALDQGVPRATSAEVVYEIDSA